MSLYPTSNSALQVPFPALFDPASNTWTSGFQTISSHLRRHPPPSYQDPDADLTDARRADATAYSAYLGAQAAPLVALSLYVSSSNWAATTRPAYSEILSFPLTWTEPLAVRTAMAQKAAHLNMSSLDTDAEAEKETEAEKAASASGWVTVPKSLRSAKKSITEAMAPEQISRIRLDALADEVLDVLQDWEARLEVSSDGIFGAGARRSAAAQCLEFAYLALMVVPDVPRPWLKDNIREKYPSLWTLVAQFRSTHFALSPWAHSDPPHKSSALDLTARFATAAIHGIPGIGGELRRWWARPRDQQQRRGDLLLGSGASLLILAVSVGAWFCYRLPRHGLPLYRYERVHAGLRGLGAAGAMFMMPSVAEGGPSLE